MREIISWMDVHVGLSGWVQAVAIIVTLIVTFSLSRRDHAERKRETLARARNAGIAIFPLLREVYAEIVWTLNMLESGRDPNQLARNGPDPDDVADLWSVTALPQPLIDLRPAMADLGDASQSTQRAYFALQELREDRRSFWDSRSELGPDAPAASLDEIATTTRHLKNCRDLLDAAMGAIAKLLK